MHPFIQKLKNKNWLIKTNETLFQWPSKITNRYTHIPRDVADILAGISECIAPNNKSWLLCLPDYLGENESAFCWNEFELTSKKAAEDDKDWVKEISLFWDNHFPVFISVAQGYEYAAISMKEDSLGKIFFGREPEYEETTLIANSYSEFLGQLSISANLNSMVK